MPDTPDAQNRETASNSNPPPIEPSRVSPFPAASHLPIQNANAPQYEEHAAKHRARNTWLQVGLLIIGTAYSFFAYQQWQAMQEQIRIAQDQMEIAKQEQRAWITVVKATLTKSLVVGERPSVTLLIQNSGKTLAYDMQVAAGTIISKEQLSGKEGPYGDIADVDNHDFSKGLLAPNAVAGSSHEAESELSQTEFNGLRNGKLFLYNGGSIEYRDTFKVLHKTTFCYWMTGKDLDTLQLHNCGYGNAAD